VGRSLKSYKLIIIGSHSVGKTTLLNAYFGKATSVEYKPTLGFDIRSKLIKDGSRSIHLTIWDMGGQLLFSKFYDRLFKETNIIFLLYDITNPLSYHELQTVWMEEIKKRKLLKVPIIIIGNKIDLKEKRAVNPDEVQEYVKKHKLDYVETSALKGINVTTLFDEVINHL